LFRKAAGYVDRILNGANPGELPVQQADRFELVINVKTAKALGLELPATVLAIADEVSERTGECRLLAPCVAGQGVESTSASGGTAEAQGRTASPDSDASDPSATFSGQFCCDAKHDSHSTM
jgi:hypothetical protein